MGCWDETCILTNLPIYSDQPCVVVLLDRFLSDNYRRKRGFQHFMRDNELSHITQIHHGTYNSYGWINEVEDKKEPHPQEEGNGKIVYVDRPLSHRFVTIFFHKEAWDKAVKAGMEESKEDWEYHLDRLRINNMFGSNASSLVTESVLREFCAVAHVAFETRRYLMLSDQFHGHQDNVSDYYDILHKLTAKIWEDCKKLREE